MRRERPNPMTPTRRYRCRLCGRVLPAWLPAAQEPDGTRLLNHLSQQHPDQVKPYLNRMHRTEDIDRVVVEAYEVMEEDPQERG